MLIVRQLTPNDNLEKAADLVWQVDPYIFPDFFGSREQAAKFGKILFTSDGGLFDFSRIFVAEDTAEPGKLLGILSYADNHISDWDCDKFKEKVKSLNIEIPKYFDRANKYYMELVVNDAKTLPDGVAEVELCATDLDSRGKGIANAMFDKFLSLKQYHEHHLTVLAANPPAINLYKKKGFQIISSHYAYPDYITMGFEEIDLSDENILNGHVGTHAMVRKSA